MPNAFSDDSPADGTDTADHRLSDRCRITLRRQTVAADHRADHIAVDVQVTDLRTAGDLMEFVDTGVYAER